MMAERYKITHTDNFAREPDIEGLVNIPAGPKETMEAIAKLINSIGGENADRYYWAKPASHKLRNDFED